MTPIFITGMKHCGKSTLGRLLSENLGLKFYDLDSLVEKNTSMSVRELYKKIGPEKFKEEEAIALRELLAHKAFICATGGGICDNIKAMELITKNGIVVYINEAWQILYKRIIKGGIPPFLKSEDPKDEFHNLYNKRSSVYLNQSNITITGEGRSPQELLIELKEKLRSSNVW